MKTTKDKRRPFKMDRKTTTPVHIDRTRRGDLVDVLTSMPAGRMVPIYYAPIFREDAVRQGTVRVTSMMHETAESLMNKVRFKCSMYLVPWLAFERFNGSMDQLNRSYMGQPPMDGQAVVNFFEMQARGAIPASQSDYGVIEYLGLHAKATDQINTMPIEAYNLIWNLRAQNRSPQITTRGRLETELAPAFWYHDAFKHIVPDWDQQAMDGAVALSVANAKLPVKGIGKDTPNWAGGVSVYETGENAATVFTGSQYIDTTPDQTFRIAQDPDNPNHPNIYAELQDNGIEVLLSNFDRVRKTQQWAIIREKYSQHSEEYIIDMLMRGLRVPDQDLKDPILLAQQTPDYTMAKRYAQDAANLTESVVEGLTYMDLKFATPPISTGGLLMMVAEALPDQIFERAEDTFFSMSSVDELPDALRDDQDAEPVDVVYNKRLDVDHATGTDVAGYEPLNAQFNRKLSKVGGRYYRPEVDGTYDQDRERVWVSEVANPTLAEEFYVSTTVENDVFVNQVKDPFDVRAEGLVVIEGLTQFGPPLVEASDNFEQVLADVPTDRIEKPAT